MTQEERELILKDLSARLPYGIKVQNVLNGSIYDLKKYLYCLPDALITNFKPYLRPLSSMTEEEYIEYLNIDNRSYSCPIDYAHIPASDRIDWLNTHHFDYRGLIEKGLAIAVTEKNNPYEN